MSNDFKKFWHILATILIDLLALFTGLVIGVTHFMDPESLPTAVLTVLSILLFLIIFNVFSIKSYRRNYSKSQKPNTGVK